MNLKILYRLLGTLVLLAFLCTSAVPAEAHSLNNGYSQITIEGRKAAYELFIPEVSLLAFDKDGDKQLTAGELGAEASSLSSYLQSHLQLEDAGQPLEFHYGPAQLEDKDGITGVRFELQFLSKYALDSITIHYNLLFDDTDPQHMNFALIMNGDDLDQTVFDSANRTYHYEALSSRSSAGTMLQYVWLGIKHIWTGYDHLLFLLSLLMVCTGWRDAVRIVTAFTAAHSVTLIMTATEVIRVRASWVELGIALTIAYVAVENWFTQRCSGNRPLRYRWLLTLAFGLIHGMGFAGALQEIGLPASYFYSSLFSFNGGVELGQLTAVAAALPLLLRWKQRSWYPRFVLAVSALIFAIAIVWFVQRVGKML